MHCMDFRFVPEIKKWMEEQKLLGDADLVSFAGAAKNIVDESSRAFALKQIEISRRLHGMKQVHLMNHMDCGAYGGHAAFTNEAAEKQKQIADMQSAAEIIKQSFPDLEVILWLAHIEEEGHGWNVTVKKV